MANKDAPFGFRPVGELGSNIQNGGTTEYDILPGLATVLYKGDLMQQLAANGTITSFTAGINANVLGVFNGCYYVDPTTLKPTWSNYYPGGITPPGSGPIIAGNLVDVEVDPETGKVDILRYTAFMDVGTAIHPSYVEGQIQGGTVQGIGWALNEGYVYDESGAMLNSSFLDYRMPTSLDVPMIDTVMIEVPNSKHPFGVRGVGEAPIIPPLPALAIAVSNAIGVKMNNLPLTPDVILDALESKGE